MDLETSLRTELDEVRAEQRRLAERARELAKMLEGPRVEPVLCFWRYHSYCEEEAMSEDVDGAFGELDGMEEHGTASTVGVRVGGYLITYTEWQGNPRLPWDEDEQIRADSDMRHRQLMAAGDA